MSEHVLKVVDGLRSPCEASKNRPSDAFQDVIKQRFKCFSRQVRHASHDSHLCYRKWLGTSAAT